MVGVAELVILINRLNTRPIRHGRKRRRRPPKVGRVHQRHLHRRVSVARQARFRVHVRVARLARVAIDAVASGANGVLVHF